MAQQIFGFGARRSWRDNATALVALALVVTVAGLFIAPRWFTDVAYLTLPLGHLVGGFAMVRYGRTSGQPDARAFRIIGSAAMLAGTGIIVVVAASLFVSIPAFSVLDTFFLTAYVLFVLGLALFPAVSHGWRSQVRIVLDGLVGAVALVGLLWGSVLAPSVAGLAVLPLDQRVVGTVYPVLDLAMIIGMMVVVLRRGTFRFDKRLLALAFGFGFQVFADLSYLQGSVAGTFNSADPNLVLFTVASLCLLVAGSLVRWSPQPVELPERATPIWSLLMPYGTAGVLIAYDAYAVLTGRSSGVLDLATATVLLLVIARQTLAIQENRTKVERERRSLIASVSHELRTPLTSMIGFLTVMQEAGDEMSPEERNELSQVVLDQANYMGRMVTDIVLLARDTPEKMTVLESVTPIQDLVSAVLDTIGESAAKVDSRIDPSLEVRIDVDRVRQLVINLLQNALRYGADRCELHLHGDDGDFVVEVHDNGPGVPKRHQVAIWERFERGPNQLNSMVPGTGLGLAIVDMIARAHGGSASYRDSELLGGACFSVSLPGRVESEVEPESAADQVKRALRPTSVRSLSDTASAP